MLEKLLQHLPWKEGRQKTGYKKLPFFITKHADAYLLYYPQGSVIPPHYDRNENGQHHRLNIILHNAEKGGEFSCKNTIYQNSRLILFRPDIEEHSVSKIEKGYRLLFSVGWVKR